MTEKQLIHELFVELKTRKLALPYTDEDCMYDVLNSWFKAFTTFRENMKKCGDPRNYSYILYDKAMTAMRPFLESYSYDFRVWWEFTQDYVNNENGAKFKRFFTKSIQNNYVTYEEMAIKIKDIQSKLHQISIECIEAIASYDTSKIDEETLTKIADSKLY